MDNNHNDQDVNLGNPENWHIVTQHQSTIDLLQDSGLGGDVHTHLDEENIANLFKEGDTVVGVLPPYLIEKLNDHGVNFLSYEIDVPHNLRNVELSKELMMKQCLPRLTHYTCKEIEDAHPPHDVSVCSQFVPRSAAEWLESKGYNVVNEKDTSHINLRTKEFRAGPEDSVVGELLARDVATICEQGAQYYQIALPDMPQEYRGRRLSNDQMNEFGAELRSFEVVRGKSLDLSGERNIQVEQHSVLREYHPEDISEIFETHHMEDLGEATEKCQSAYESVARTNDLIAQDENLQQMQTLSEEMIVDNMYKQASEGAAKGKVAHLILGLPGSGKSSVIAKHLMETDNAFELDSDLIKDKLPGYMNGYGAGAVHEKSDGMMKEIMNTALDNGDSFVHPVIGKTMEGLDKKIALFKEHGYEVYIHNVQVPKEISVHRAVARYNETGRYVDPGYIMSINPDDIDGNFDALTKDDRIAGYSEWDNHVEFGDDPNLIRSQNIRGVPDTDINTKLAPENLRDRLRNAPKSEVPDKISRFKNAIESSPLYENHVLMRENELEDLLSKCALSQEDCDIYMQEGQSIMEDRLVKMEEKGSVDGLSHSYDIVKGAINRTFSEGNLSRVVFKEDYENESLSTNGEPVNEYYERNIESKNFIDGSSIGLTKDISNFIETRNGAGTVDLSNDSVPYVVDINTVILYLDQDTDSLVTRKMISQEYSYTGSPYELDGIFKTEEVSVTEIPSEIEIEEHLLQQIEK